MRLNDEIQENRLLTRWADLLPRSPGQTGGVHETDAELVRLGDGRLLALTVDTVSEEIRLGLYSDPRTAGRVAAAAALSDLAAVGAEPLGLLLSVTLPEDEAGEIQGAVARGVAECVNAAGTFVLGGDTNAGPSLSVACTAVGIVPEGQELRRTGLLAGHVLFAAGPLGLGAACAATLLFGAKELFSEDDFSIPCRIPHGMALRACASAAMDSSDGLISTLDQMMRLNGVSLNITRPAGELLHPRAREVARHLDLSPLALLAAIHGEFELIFGLPPERRKELERIAAHLGWHPLEIGAAGEGWGLSIGDRPVDGALFRNLLSVCGNDPHVYAQRLIAAVT